MHHFTIVFSNKRSSIVAKGRIKHFSATEPLLLAHNRDIFFRFISNWNGYDRTDSFPVDSWTKRITRNTDSSTINNNPGVPQGSVSCKSFIISYIY